MPSQLANYQCPNCGGPLRFDPELQKLKCDYCESVFTAAEVESFFSEKEEMAASAVGFRRKTLSRRFAAPGGLRGVTDDFRASIDHSFCNYYTAKSE